MTNTIIISSIMSRLIRQRSNSNTNTINIKMNRLREDNYDNTTTSKLYTTSTSTILE